MSDLPTPEPTLDDALDIQHDPFPPQGDARARRIPHLGHVALLLGLLAGSTLCCTVIWALLQRRQPSLRSDSVAIVGLEAGIYLLTLLACITVFPLVWKRSFAQGIEWNSLALRRFWPALLATGLALCGFSQLGERFIRLPQHTDLDKVLSTEAGAWSALVLGVFLAPACEEILFRGFLLPAFAIAYDWLSLDRTPAGMDRWRSSTAHSPGARIFGALLSSLCFGLLHAPQLHFAWGAVVIITGVGLGLAAVRLRTHSVACSTLVHMTYNGALFAAMLVVTHGFRHLDKLQS